MDYRAGGKLPALVIFGRYDPVHGDCTAFIFWGKGYGFSGGGDAYGLPPLSVLVSSKLDLLTI